MKCHHLETLSTKHSAWNHTDSTTNIDAILIPGCAKFQWNMRKSHDWPFVAASTVVSGRTETWRSGRIFSCVVACFSFRFRSVFRAAAMSSKRLSKHFFFFDCRDFEVLPRCLALHSKLIAPALTHGTSEEFWHRMKHGSFSCVVVECLVTFTQLNKAQCGSQWH